MLDASLQLRPGGIFGHVGFSPMSRGIEILTCSKWSHISGVVEIGQRHLRRAVREFQPRWSLPKTWDDGPYLVESTTLCDRACELMRRPIQGVQVHEPISRVNSYGGRVWYFQIKEEYALDREEQDKLAMFALRMIGREYDKDAAILSGTRVVKWLLNRDEDLSSVYCDALWGAFFKEIGKWPLSNVEMEHPGSFVKILRSTGMWEPPVLVHDASRNLA